MKNEVIKLPLSSIFRVGKTPIKIPIPQSLDTRVLLTTQTSKGMVCTVETKSLTAAAKQAERSRVISERQKALRKAKTSQKASTSPKIEG